MSGRSAAMIEPEVHEQTQQGKQRHPGVGPSRTAEMVHRPSQEQRWNESTQRPQTTDDTYGRTRFFGEHERDNLENAAVAKSGRRADDEDGHKKSGKLIRLEKSRQAEAAHGHR